jgi:hypothetical protein
MRQDEKKAQQMFSQKEIFKNSDNMYELLKVNRSIKVYLGKKKKILARRSLFSTPLELLA